MLKGLAIRGKIYVKGVEYTMNIINQLKKRENSSNNEHGENIERD